MINYGRNEHYIIPLASERNNISKELKQYCKDENICICYFKSIIEKLLNK